LAPLIALAGERPSKTNAALFDRNWVATVDPEKRPG